MLRFNKTFMFAGIYLSSEKPTESRAAIDVRKQKFSK